MDDIVNISLKEVNFKCDRRKLCSESQYFDSMFKSKMQESLNSEIKLGCDIEPTIFEIILSFIHGDNFEEKNINEKNAKQLIETAQYLQINNLMLICERIIINNIDFNNCFEYLRFSQKFSFDKIFEKCISILLEYFFHLKKHFYLILPEALFIKLMSHDSLNTKEEEHHVLNLVLRYLTDKQITNKAEEFLSCIHFFEIEPNTIKEIIDKYVQETNVISYYLWIVIGIIKTIKNGHNFLKGKIEIKDSDSIINITSFEDSTNLAPHDLENIKNMAFRAVFKGPRKRIKDVAILLNPAQDDDLTGDQLSIQIFSTRDLQYQRKTKCPEVTKLTSSLQGLVMSSDLRKLFFLGGEHRIGSNKWQDPFVLDLDQSTFKPLPFYLSKRRHFTTAVVGNQLYLIGGYGQYRMKNDIIEAVDLEQLRPDQDEAPQESRRVPVKVEGFVIGAPPLVVSSQHLIYLVSGSLLQFDTSTSTFSHFHMNYSSAQGMFTAAFIHLDQLFAVSACDGSIHIYLLALPGRSPADSHVHLLCAWKTEYFLLTAFPFNGRILVLTSAHVFFYDLLTREVEQHPLPEIGPHKACTPVDSLVDLSIFIDRSFPLISAS